jgi:hypothetical protein
VQETPEFSSSAGVFVPIWKIVLSDLPVGYTSLIFAPMLIIYPYGTLLGCSVFFTFILLRILMIRRIFQKGVSVEGKITTKGPFSFTYTYQFAGEQFTRKAHSQKAVYVNQYAPVHVFFLPEKPGSSFVYECF